MYKTFGQFVKEMRLKQGLTLRKFCIKYGLDPGNFSKLERGLLDPPSSREKLEQYASYLGIKKNSDDWFDFFNLAAISSGKIPPDILNDKQLVEKLPIFFRTLTGKKVSKEKLIALAELIRRT